MATLQDTRGRSHQGPHAVIASERGFTFIEIMVVVAILAIFAALVVPRIMGRTDDAKRTAAKVQIRNIEGALQLYKLDNGVYPSTEQGLKALIEKPRRRRDSKKMETRWVPAQASGRSLGESIQVSEPCAGSRLASRHQGRL